MICFVTKACSNFYCVLTKFLFFSIKYNTRRNEIEYVKEIVLIMHVAGNISVCHNILSELCQVFHCF